MIVYIHGFGGSGRGGKATEFRNYFKSKDIAFMAPSLSYVPDLAISTLEELIESFNEVSLIGSSLGGFYTIYLASKYNLRAVLINPSIYPWKTLERSLGNAPNFYDESYFEWKKSHLEMLKTFETKNSKDENFMLLAQKGDELLDYSEAVQKLPNSLHVIEEGGNHSFEGIDKHLEIVKKFLLNYN